MIPAEQESNPVDVKFRGGEKNHNIVLCFHDENIKDKTSAASG